MTTLLEGTLKGTYPLGHNDFHEGRSTPKKQSHRFHSVSTSDFNQKKRPQILLDNFSREEPPKVQLRSPEFRIKSRHSIEIDPKSDSMNSLLNSPSSTSSKSNVPQSGEFRKKSTFSLLKTPTRESRSIADKLEDPSTTTSTLGYYLKSPKPSSLETPEKKTPNTTTNASLSRHSKALAESFLIHKPMRTQSDEMGSMASTQKYFLAKPRIASENLSKNSPPQVTLKPKELAVRKQAAIPEVTGGAVKAFGANTHDGLVRKYNEDKVSIILNILKPSNLVNESWPKCSFFGVYDGHGGPNCADFLRDNLYRFVIKEPSFPSNPREALRKGFQAAEAKFLELAQSMPDGKLERSGSCALVVLIVGDVCYVANVGDSRAVMSGDGGRKVFTLTKDHKPCEESEQKRIIEAGGKIYQSQIEQKLQGANINPANAGIIAGPARVLPGRLSVSRTFGDAFAKLPQYGGNPDVVIAEPEIKAFKIHPHYDFIILGCDGIFDKLSSREAIETAWKGINADPGKLTAHQKCANGAEMLLQEAMHRRSLDNVTAVLISFTDFTSSNEIKPTVQEPSKEDTQPPFIESPIIAKQSMFKFNTSGLSTTEQPKETTNNEKNSVNKVEMADSSLLRHRSNTFDYGQSTTEKVRTTPKHSLPSDCTELEYIVRSSKGYRRAGSIGLRQQESGV